MHAVAPVAVAVLFRMTSIAPWLFAAASTESGFITNHSQPKMMCEDTKVERGFHTQHAQPECRGFGAHRGNGAHARYHRSGLHLPQPSMQRHCQFGCASSLTLTLLLSAHDSTSGAAAAPAAAVAAAAAAEEQEEQEEQEDSESEPEREPEQSLSLTLSRG